MFVFSFLTRCILFEGIFVATNINPTSQINLFETFLQAKLRNVGSRMSWRIILFQDAASDVRFCDFSENTSAHDSYGIED